MNYPTLAIPSSLFGVTTVANDQRTHSDTVVVA
jgi:hypothetical protein